jgi:hypothetical protein
MIEFSELLDVEVKLPLLMSGPDDAGGSDIERN